MAIRPLCVDLDERLGSVSCCRVPALIPHFHHRRELSHYLSHISNVIRYWLFYMFLFYGYRRDKIVTCITLSSLCIKNILPSRGMGFVIMLLSTIFEWDYNRVVAFLAQDNAYT